MQRFAKMQMESIDRQVGGRDVGFFARMQGASVSGGVQPNKIG